MAFWDQTGDADGSTRGNYFPCRNAENLPLDGEYDLLIGSVRHKGDGYKGESVIVSVTVLTSNNDMVVVGASKSCAWNLTKQKDMALNNIKSFVCGVYGWPDGAKDSATKEKVNLVARRMVEADNPLGGVKVHLSTFHTKTGRGGDFTNLDWSPYVAEPGYVPPMPGASVNLHAPPPPPPAAPGNAAKARAQATPGWVLADGRWYDGVAWQAP